VIVQVHRAVVGPDGQAKMKNRQAFVDQIAAMRPGTVVEIMVAEEPLHPTHDQHKYYRGVVLEVISEHTGHTEEYLRGYLLEEIAGLAEGDGTSGMTMQEMSDYIEACCCWCWDHFGFIPPAPESVKDLRHRDFA